MLLQQQSSPDVNMLSIPDFVVLMSDSLVLKETVWANAQYIPVEIATDGSVCKQEPLMTKALIKHIEEMLSGHSYIQV